MYLINLLAEKIKSFRANESKSHTDLYTRGYIHAMEELELSPTKETYNWLMVEQDDQVNRNDFDRGIKAYLDQYEFKKDKEMNIYYENIQWEERLSVSGRRFPTDSIESVNKEISDWNGLYFPKIAHGKVRPEFESPISNQIDFANSITDASGNQVIFQTAEDCIEWIKENVKEQYWPNTEKERRIARSERYLK